MANQCCADELSVGDVLVGHGTVSRLQMMYDSYTDTEVVLAYVGREVIELQRDEMVEYRS